MITAWFEYEVKMPPPYGIPGWRRTRFSYYPHVFGTTDNPVDEAVAHEMLLMQARRYRPDTHFRLVRVTEELVGGEITSPGRDEG